MRPSRLIATRLLPYWPGNHALFFGFDLWSGVKRVMLTFLVQLVKDVDLLQHILDNLCYRIEGKGKGILQHHQIIAEFEAIPEAIRKILAGGAFSEVLRSTQVTPLITHAFFFLLYPKFWEFSLTVFFFLFCCFRKQLFCLHGLPLLCAQGLVSGSTSEWMSKHLLLRSCVLLSIFISRRNLLMEGKSEYWLDASF